MAALLTLPPDSHCHPTDTPSALPQIQTMRTPYLTTMSTRTSDQHLVHNLALQYPDKIIPSFGWHPWFSWECWDDEDEELISAWGGDGDPAEIGGGNKAWELNFKTLHYTKVLKGPGGEGPSPVFIELLPMPRKLRGDIANELRRRINFFKDRGQGVVLGEVGLDKGYRMPWPPGYSLTPNDGDGAGDSRDDEGSNSGGGASTKRALSPYKLSMSHQLIVFKVQWAIAGEFSIPASVHGVQAHGTLWDTIREAWKGWEIPRESRRERRERIHRGRKLGGEEREWVDRFLLNETPPPALSSDNEDEDEGGGGGDDDSQYLPPISSLSKQLQKEGQPPFPPRICLHSFSAPPQTLSQYLTPPSPTTAYPSTVYFSFSTTINARNEEKWEDVLRRVPREWVLVESDLHEAGEGMDKKMEEAVMVVGRVWGVGEEQGGVEGVREVVRLLEGNWRGWVFSRETA